MGHCTCSYCYRARINGPCDTWLAPLLFVGVPLALVCFFDRTTGYVLAALRFAWRHGSLRALIAVAATAGLLHLACTVYELYIRNEHNEDDYQQRNATDRDAHKNVARRVDRFVEVHNAGINIINQHSAQLDMRCDALLQIVDKHHVECREHDKQLRATNEHLLELEKRVEPRRSGRLAAVAAAAAVKTDVT